MLLSPSPEHRSTNSLIYILSFLFCIVLKWNRSSDMISCRTHKNLVESQNIKSFEYIQLIKIKNGKSQIQGILVLKYINSNFNLETEISRQIDHKQRAHREIDIPPPNLTMLDPNLTTVQGIMNRKWIVSFGIESRRQNPKPCRKIWRNSIT